MPLIDHFRKQFAKQHNKTDQERLARRHAAALRLSTGPATSASCATPCETMVVLDTDGLLDVDDLPPESGRGGRSCPRREPTGPTAALVGQAARSDRDAGPSPRRCKLTSGNREETARILGIGARTLYRKLEKYDL